MIRGVLLAILLGASTAGGTTEKPLVQAEICLGIDPNGGVEALAPPPIGKPVEDLWGELSHLWCWSPGEPPIRRFPGKAAEDPDLEPVAVDVWAGEGESCQGLELIAAPTAMWKEVPEPWLPRVDIPKDCRLRLRRQLGHAWRIRAISGPRRKSDQPLMGSGWLELESAVRRFVVPLQLAQDFALDVIDQQGTPIDNARLDLLRRNAASHQAMLAGFAAEGGKVEIPSLTGSGIVTALVDASGYIGRSFESEPRALPKVVILTSGATLRGRFVDAKAEPLAGIEVEAETWLDPRSRLLLRRQAESAEDGSWLLEELPAGEVLLEVRSQEHATWRKAIQVVPSGVDLGEILLEKGRTVPLQLLDLDDIPIPGAWVEEEGQRLAIADREGYLEIEGVSPHRGLRLLADAEGFQSEEISIGIEEIGDPLQVRLRPAFEIIGFFLDSQQEPLERADAELRVGSTSWTERLAADGSFRFELPPGKPVELTLRSPTSTRRIVHLEPGLAGELRDLGELLAPPGLVVVGKVYAEEDHHPIPGARVWLPRPTEGDPLVSWFRGDLLESRTDGEGRFRLEGLEQAATELRVDASGFAQGRFRLRSSPEIEEGEPIDLGDLHLVRGRTVEVEVVGEEAPSAVARLDLAGRWREMDMLESPVAGRSAIFYNIAPGTAHLSVLSEGELVCEEKLEIPEGEGPFEATCRREAMILSGVVRIGGELAGPGKLVWLPPIGEEPSMVIRQPSPLGQQGSYTLGAGRPVIQVEVNESGYFSSGKLRPGAWKVGWQGAEGGSSAPIEVVLPVQDRAEIALDFPGYRIEGRVVDTEGHVVAGARVRELASGSLELSAADGSFKFVAFEAGSAYLRAEHNGEESPTVQVSLGPEQPVDVVELALGSDDQPERLRVTALGPTEAPLPGAFIFVDLGSQGLRILTADLQGTAELRLDPPTPRVLRLAGWAAGTWFLGAPIPLTEAMAEPQVLHFSEGGALRIRNSGQQSPFRLLSETGWDLGLLMARLGHPPLSTGAHDERAVEGLPKGTYRVEASDGSLLGTSTLQPGGQSFIELN